MTTAATRRSSFHWKPLTGAALAPHRFGCGLHSRNAALAPHRLGCGLRPGRRDAEFASPTPPQGGSDTRALLLASSITPPLRGHQPSPDGEG